MFRVWHMVKLEKKEFLGSVHISRDVLLDPPKGRRAFPLKQDMKMVKMTKCEPLEITGNHR